MRWHELGDWAFLGVLLAVLMITTPQSSLELNIEMDNGK